MSVGKRYWYDWNKPVVSVVHVLVVWALTDIRQEGSREVLSRAFEYTTEDLQVSVTDSVAQQD